MKSRYVVCLLNFLLSCITHTYKELSQCHPLFQKILCMCCTQCSKTLRIHKVTRSLAMFSKGYFQAAEYHLYSNPSSAWKIMILIVRLNLIKISTTFTWFLQFFVWNKTSAISKNLWCHDIIGKFNIKLNI